MLSFLTEGGPAGTQTWPMFDYTNEYVWLPPLSISETNSTCLHPLIHNLYSILQYNPCSRALHDKLTGTQLIKKFHAFYGTQTFITEFTRARHLSVSWARSTQSKLSSHFLKIYLVIHYLSLQNLLAKQTILMAKILYSTLPPKKFFLREILRFPKFYHVI
jgi:hypothetical protein